MVSLTTSPPRNHIYSETYTNTLNEVLGGEVVRNTIFVIPWRRSNKRYHICDSLEEK
jgi:hypothetical protein